MNETLAASTLAEEERHIRRVQVTGRGSYIVSVPKRWVEEAGLRKGGRVELVKQDRGLLLTPFEKAGYADERTTCTLTIPPSADPDSVARRVISLYVVGFSTIHVTSGSGSLPAALRDSIRDVARSKLVGTELVNESSRSATLQVLLSFPQLLVPDALRRMGSITSSMQQEAVQSLTQCDHELASQVVKIDDEIDRFSLYIIRQLKWAVQHPPLIERIGLRKPVECLGYRIIVKSVERSADHATRIARNSLIVDEPLASALAKDINSLNQFSANMMETALKALFANEYQMAESVLLTREKMGELESKLVERLLREKLPAGNLSSLRLVLESLRRIGEYATDIAEVVLNLTIQESL